MAPLALGYESTDYLNTLTDQRRSGSSIDKYRGSESSRQLVDTMLALKT